MSHVRKTMLTLLTAGVLTAFGIPDTPLVGHSEPVDRECASGSCENFCYSEPGCETFASCEIIAATCLATTEFGTCRHTF